MRYNGAKTRIATELVNFIRQDSPHTETFVDLFMGSCSVLSRAASLWSSTIGNDLNSSLVELYVALRNGWVPPELTVDEAKDLFLQLKNSNASTPLKTLLGFGCSFGGIWFAGYAGDYKTSRSSAIKKAAKMRHTEFGSKDYSEVTIPANATVYADIPYSNSLGYGSEFDYITFYDWAQKQANTVYVSEYRKNIPSEFVSHIVWEKTSRRHLNKKVERATTEVLLKFN